MPVFAQVACPQRSSGTHGAGRCSVLSRKRKNALSDRAWERVEYNALSNSIGFIAKLTTPRPGGLVMNEILSKQPFRRPARTAGAGNSFFPFRPRGYSLSLFGRPL